ncbi:Transcription elongation factor SPT5 [Frankliniella fusca]|uniref:Transcription elongation factor SPT5 n=1 Tax=Frankliniella fusca TaxID=407009 RepID=A0AAE1HD70_9NEOP|nr:Transcription elongation factor SPT5 [Frankliniella fusca]
MRGGGRVARLVHNINTSDNAAQLVFTLPSSSSSSHAYSSAPSPSSTSSHSTTSFSSSSTTHRSVTDTNTVSPCPGQSSCSPSSSSPSSSSPAGPGPGGVAAVASSSPSLARRPRAESCMSRHQSGSSPARCSRSRSSPGGSSSSSQVRLARLGLRSTSSSCRRSMSSTLRTSAASRANAPSSSAVTCRGADQTNTCFFKSGFSTISSHPAVIHTFSSVVPQKSAFSEGHPSAVSLRSGGIPPDSHRDGSRSFE